MQKPRIDFIRIDPGMGVHISEAKRAAIFASMEHACDVEFKFNATVYRVKYLDMLSHVREYPPVTGHHKE